jgi:hypothetical protein
MQTPETEKPREQKPFAASLGAILGILLIPVLMLGACLAIPYTFVLRWMRQRREHKFKLLMKSCGRLIMWPDLQRHMHDDDGGTCIEERFSPKGPVRFWWTREDVYKESPYEIIDWFTMRKGRRAEPFIHWCHARYTSVDGGSAVLVDTTLVQKGEIYTLWAECRSDVKTARWVEVAPPEILPWRPGQ